MRRLEDIRRYGISQASYTYEKDKQADWHRNPIVPKLVQELRRSGRVILEKTQALKR